MNAEQFAIVEAFSTLSTQLTINQIAKKIKKSYAFTNKYTHELLNLGVLKQKKVGPSILCSLDYGSELTIACLVFNSISKSDTTPDLSEPRFRLNGKMHMLADMDQDRFTDLIRNADFRQLVVLSGHEVFWRKVAEVAP